MFRYHNGYMSEIGRIEFTVPQEGSFTVTFCEPQLNILAHAQAIELDLGSRCGGHGICGGDRVRTTLPAADRETLLSPITDREKHHLTAEELQQGWRLACQCFPEKGARSLEFETYRRT